MAQALTLSRPMDGLAKLWRAYPRETVAFGVLGLAAVAAIAGAAHSTPELPAPRGSAVTVPAPPPLIVRHLPPDQALKINQTIPLATGPNPAAAPSAFSGNGAARKRALECLASAVYYE